MMKSIIKLFLFSFLSFNLVAAELDQYPFMFENQRDAANVINEKFNSMLRKFIFETNSYIIKPRSCSRAVIQAAGGFQKGVESKIGRWTRISPKVDQRPRTINGKEGNYYDKSIYFDPKIPDIWPMTILKRLAPVINFNNIYIGGDKIGHMTDQGHDMYRFYTDTMNVGVSRKKAIDRALGLGLFSEKTVLGGMGSGVISFGDLEANYQGFMMYRDMCEGKNPYVGKNSKGQWVVKRKIDLRDYVNPYMSEVFNPNAYTSKEKLAMGHIRKKYCNVNYFKNSHLMTRQSYYLKIAKQSYMYKYLRKQIAKGNLKENTKNHIYYICKDLVKIKDLKR